MGIKNLFTNKMLLWFFLAELISLIYIKLTYSDYKGRWFFPYLAMFFGCCTQFFWANAVKTSQSSSQITAIAVIWDASTFLTWSLVPLMFFSAKFNLNGFIGLFLITTGIILVGSQKF